MQLSMGVCMQGKDKSHQSNGKHRVFITGGGAGLGRALARQLADQGALVLIGDIDMAAAQEAADEIGGFAIKCDVRREDDFNSVNQWLSDHWGGIDLLVNNAGVAQMGPLDKTPIADWQWIMDINVLGIVRACQALLPIMAPGARVLNIASMAALLYLPNSAAYNATKSAVLAISETLMLEWEHRGISVHVACPAFFRTDLARSMRSTDPETERVTKRLVERSRLGADQIAGLILAGLANGKPHILTHDTSRRSWLLKRFLPFDTYEKMMRKQIKHMNARMARPSKSDK